MGFVPLHIYSEYSFLKSGMTMEKLFAYAAKTGATSLGISDFEVMFGLPNFVNLSKKYNIEPILGMDVKINDSLYSLYVISEQGYFNLIAITNAIHKKEFSLDFLLSHLEDLIVVHSVKLGDNDIFFSKDFLLELANIKKQCRKFYLGLGIYQNSDVMAADNTRLFAQQNDFDIIAFPHIKYLKASDAIVLDIADAIANNRVLDYKKLDGPFYFPDKEIMSFYHEDEISATSALLELIDFSFIKKRGTLLKFEHNGNENFLQELCYQGLAKQNKQNDAVYLARLHHEINIINKMGYNDYFLIVNDYVNFAKTNDILVGPGRGSAAGSLVSYALGITLPDPIATNLLFERFLNPNRITMPDIDIDFEDVRRNEVVDYLRLKYGKKRIANITTFQTIGAKQAIRDIGRVFAYASHEIDYLSKFLGMRTISFKEAYREIPSFKKLLDDNEYYLEFVALASKIEGLIRQNGIHAAGIILNNTPIEDALPIIIDSDGNYVTQYEMNDLEAQGFLKMDLLALRNLTIMKRCLALTNNAEDFYKLPYEDETGMKLIHDNQTMGIFQLESSGMKNAVNTLKPSIFEDVVALLALFRPGPMDAIPSYARRKSGLEQPSYLNTTLEKILKPTYGIIIYQEQIMQIVTEMSGFSLAEADNLRRAISKKDATAISLQKNAFIQGALNKGYQKDDAVNVFNLIEKFADYGFNRAHSVSYSIITCQMAYLKAHYPLAFYAAILESESGFTNTKFSDYLREIRQHNIKISAPDINLSELSFSIHNDALLFPLLSIKGLSRQMTQTVIEERNKLPFVDFFDFVERLLPHKINKELILKLINAGAFDKFATRATLRSSIDNALNQAKIKYSMKNNPNLLGSDFLSFDLIETVSDPLYDLNQEFDVLGVMLSGSPLAYKKEILEKENVLPINEIESAKGNISIAGMIKSVKIIKTKTNAQMAYVSMADGSGELEATVFPELYASCRDIIKINGLIIVSGHIEFKRQNFIADTIKTLEEK